MVSLKQGYNYLIIVFFGLLSLYSLFLIGNRQNLSLFFELFLLFFVFASFPKIDKRAILFVLASFFYILGSYVYIVFFNKTHILDFILAYKVIFYILILYIFLNKNFISLNFLKKLFYFLVVVFFVKYSVSLYGGFDHRPIVFVENNFELMFLLLLAILVYHLNGFGVYSFLALLAIFIMSGSKSAILAFAFSFPILLVSTFTFKRIFIAIVFFILCLLSVEYVFLSRGGFSLEGVDRFLFLQVFLDEYKEFSILNYLFGVERLSPLSSSSCTSLAFYQKLFSYGDEKICYSVILHSFNLRMLYDHGMFIFALVLYSIYKLLDYSSYSLRIRVIVLGVGLINGLSVSSLNSVFFALALFFYLGVYFDNECKSNGIAKRDFSRT